QQLNEWIPWLSALLLGVFGIIVLPKVTQPLANYLINQVGWNIPSHDVPLFIGTTIALGLTVYSWNQLSINNYQLPITNYQLPNPIERIFGKFQLLSACFVAFAHGSNDVGNAIAPLAAIAYINRTGKVPIYDLDIPVWILVIGGAGIVVGLAVLGKKVIATIGESIIT
ncbi:MAG: inorganic phosphate transporter, partial [Cyanobacteria bacterium J06629_18]